MQIDQLKGGPGANMAAQATAQAEAEAATQGDEFGVVEVDEAKCTNGWSTSHIDKKTSCLKWSGRHSHSHGHESGCS